MYRRHLLELVGGAAAAAVAFTRPGPEEAYEEELSSRYDAWWELGSPPEGDSDLLQEARRRYEEKGSLYAAREDPSTGPDGIHYRFHLHPEGSQKPAASDCIERERVPEIVKELSRCASEIYAEEGLAGNVMEGDLP